MGNNLIHLNSALRLYVSLKTGVKDTRSLYELEILS